MKMKHLAIDIVPRVLWIIEGLTLFYVNKFYSIRPDLTSDQYNLVIGSVITAIGTAYLLWTFRFLAKPVITKELVTTGPYRFSRHPMYVGIYIIFIGVGILYFTNLWFVILLAFIPLWYFVCKLEEKQMIKLHGDKYKLYKKNTCMFFPKC